MQIKNSRSHFGKDNMNFGPVGTLKPIPVNVSASDYTVTTEIRLITCTSGTKITVDMSCDDGVIIGAVLPAAGSYFPVMNVTKIYQVGTDATDIHVWPLES